MKCKYPIILVHGIALKDVKFFKAFGRIENILKAEGNIVYTSETDGFGTIENNAQQLKKQILEVLEKDNTRRTPGTSRRVWIYTRRYCCNVLWKNFRSIRNT